MSPIPRNKVDILHDRKVINSLINKFIFISLLWNMQNLLVKKVNKKDYPNMQLPI